MAVKASCTITLSCYRDTQSVTRYYKLQSSTASKPSVPTTKPPSGWDDTEPSYTSGSTNTLYFCDLTVFSDGTWAYSSVSKSSSYEAAKEAYNKAQNAQDSVDNLKVGGKNLFEGSADLVRDNFSFYLRPTQNVTPFVYETGKDTSVPSGKCIAITFAGITTLTDGGPYLLESKAKYISKMTAGETYTVSVWVKCSTAKDTGVIRAEFLKNVRIVSNPNLSTDWQRYVITGEYNGNTSSAVAITFYYGSKLEADDVFYISSPKVEYGDKATDWTPAPEDVTDDINEIATTVQEQRTDIISDCENIILTSLKSYVTTGDYEELRSTVQSQLQILSDEINMKFTKTSDEIDTVNKDLQSKLTELYKHISFSDEGIIVKSGENSIELQLDNEKGIIFSKNGNPFGTWDGTNFHTGNILIDVNERAQFGNFAFVPRSDGSLMFLKVGG